MIREIRSYTQKLDIELLRRAYQFAYEAHKHQFRISGDPYIEHCLGTAVVLTELRMDPVTIASGLLHDVVEDTGIGIDEVKEVFGEEISRLVDGVTKISELKFQSQAEKQAENFRKMIFSMAQDLRVIMIKFADRLQNMRTIEYLPPEKAKRIALETREVYAPLAHRFGIARIKWELEDLSLKVLDRNAYDLLIQKIADRKEERERYIREIANPIKRELTKVGIQSEITGRAKTLYSIYRKMQERKKSFEEIYDLLAIRIIVQKVDECYFALGVVHTLFTPVQDRFKDYIATPKLNMYQSLHTTVIGPAGKMVEIQVRTEEMHRVADIGIAAHWKYKEKRKSEDELDRYSAWLREMIDWQKDTLDPEEYLDFLKTDLFISEVFVFTPKGDLLKLPIGSTPVDFAFAVHTDIGLHCIGAKVNGHIVSLNTKLQSGDIVEIITSVNQRPSQDWITFVKSSKAKSNIKRWFKESQLQEAIRLGEEILIKGLKRYRIRRSNEQIKALAQKMGKSKVEQLYADLGQGTVSIQKIAEALSPHKVLSPPEIRKENIIERFITRAKGSSKGIRVQGVDNLLIRFAQCCHPVPGDSIVGFISKGRGIVIHRRDCGNALKLMEIPERNVEVTWDVGGEEAFVVRLRILATERKDFLKDIAGALSAMDTHILNVNMSTENTIITSYVILEVKNLSHLTRIIQQLNHIKGIISVQRESCVEESMEKSSYH
ncbi:bifunctional (p)ppGpp synthetase/guanosine-3',5'-bis(diphosphate) 3'-pyrophosphohydrolase [bacterium]|nr:bifunctional (p)ppGpp synthetase/guanosine-3',5'-bis(diphosphate) 3'-pyrophosphohydrolase [bacterium]